MFAQQSIREMTRTGRSADEVMPEALRGAPAAGFSGKQGADADHLKTPADVDRTAAAGFVFFTIDPSDHVDGQADSYDERTINDKVKALGEAANWVQGYKGRKIDLPNGTKITIDDKA